MSLSLVLATASQTSAFRGIAPPGGVRPVPVAFSWAESPADSMVKPPRPHPFGRILNTVLVALSFGLLAWVIWRNRAEVAAVFSRSLDLRLFGLAFLMANRRTTKPVA